MAFDFQSVGGAMGDAVQQHITEQRELKRRALLDALNQRDTESSISARDEQARSISAQRQSEIAKEKLKIFQDAHRAGDQIDLDKLDPITLELLKKNQMVNTATPTTSTGEAVQDAQGNWIPSGDQQVNKAPARSVYSGTADEQRGIESQAALRAILDDKNLNPEAKQWLQIVLAGRDPEKGLTNPPAGIFDSPKPDYIIDQATGKMIPATDSTTGKPITSKSGRITSRTRPPVGPQPQYVGTDAQGRALAMSGGKLRVVPIEGNPDAKINPKPSAAGQKGRISTADINSLKTARTAVNTAKEKAPLWGENPALASANQNVVSIQNKMISAIPTSRTQADARKIMESPLAQSRDIPDIISQLETYWAAKGEPLTTEETQALSEILPSLLGKY